MILRRCGDEPVRQMCRLILRDEAGHISFHRDRLAARYPEGAPMAWKLAFRGLGLACGAFLWWSHGRWLRTTRQG